MVKKKDKKNEIFIEEKEQIPLDEDIMTETEESINSEPVLPETEQPTDPEPKKEKKKKVYKRDAATVERLKKQLEAGRKKSMETRRKKAELKKLQQLDSLEKSENELYEKLKKKQEGKRQKDELLNENELLKKKLENYKLELENLQKKNIQILPDEIEVKKEKVKPAVQPKQPKKGVSKANPTEKKEKSPKIEIQGGLPPGFAGSQYSLYDAFQDLRKKR